jgi:hypothetical protein
MNLFKRPVTQTNLEKHQSESAKAFDVFNQTIDALTLSNKGIEESIGIEEATITEAKYNLDRMEMLLQKNSKVIAKITEFFSL